VSAGSAGRVGRRAVIHSSQVLYGGGGADIGGGYAALGAGKRGSAVRFGWCPVGTLVALEVDAGAACFSGPRGVLPSEATDHASHRPAE